MNLLLRRPVRIVLDISLLIGFGAEFVTREGPDYDVHSWIGVVLMPIVAVHLASNWRWITATVRRRAQHPEWPLARFNAVFAVVTAVCIATGFPPWLDESASGLWSGTHNITGFLSIVLALSHLWRNRSRVGTLIGRRSASRS